MDNEVIKHSIELDLILKTLQSLKEERPLGGFSIKEIAIKSGISEELTISLIQYLSPKFIDKTKPLTSSGRFNVIPKVDITAFLASGGFSYHKEVLMKKEAESQLELNLAERATIANEESVIASRNANNISLEANAIALEALKKSKNANQIAWWAVVAAGVAVVIEIIRFFIEKK